mgnify:CR=1 FL=1
MSEEKILKTIDELYEKYGVDRIFYSDMEVNEIMRGMKGILAELDLKKQKSYTKEDAEIIKDIYGLFC